MNIERDASGKPVGLIMVMPSDEHQHLRKGAMLKLVAPMVAKRFCSAIIMPNTDPPITTVLQAENYFHEIIEVTGEKFFPKMTFYLTDMLSPAEVERAFFLNAIFGIKYYPRGLTTGSDKGVANPASLWDPNSNVYEVLRVLADHDGVFLVHAADGFDKNGVELDPYDQEKHFISETLPRIIEAHPNLKISVEHISTKEGVEFIKWHNGPKLGCSVTAQHLLLDRRDVFRGGFRPHRFWWPIIQPSEHREALWELVKKQSDYVWLGSDSAPHPIGKKETDCCSGGVLMAHAGIELYAEAFDSQGCLELLEKFASVNGPKFFGREPSTRNIQLKKETWEVLQPLYCVEPDDRRWPPAPETRVIPFRLGEEIQWKLID